MLLRGVMETQVHIITAWFVFASYCTTSTLSPARKLITLKTKKSYKAVINAKASIIAVPLTLDL